VFRNFFFIACHFGAGLLTNSYVLIPAAFNSWGKTSVFHTVAVRWQCLRQQLSPWRLRKLHVIQSVLQSRLLVVNLSLGTGRGYSVKVFYKQYWNYVSAWIS